MSERERGPRGVFLTDLQDTPPALRSCPSRCFQVKRFQPPGAKTFRSRVWSGQPGDKNQRPAADDVGGF